jgi:flagellar biosynthesis/type III secretory pathway protein FliH
MPARRYFDSPNLVARLNLPNMVYEPTEKIEVYAQAVRGLLELELQPEKRIKYLDFIDIYTDLDDNERDLYRQRYPHEAETMTGFAERFREEGMQRGMMKGMQKGMQQGMQQGEAKVLIRQLTKRFGELPEEISRKIETADADTLLQWSERVLTAKTLDEVLH